MSAPASPAKRGRPPKAPSQRRDKNITFRTPGGLRERLQQAATGAGRSTSEEVLHRLEMSFAAQSGGGLSEGDKTFLIRLAAIHASILLFRRGLSMTARAVSTSEEMIREFTETGTSTHPWERPPAEGDRQSTSWPSSAQQGE